MPKRSISTAVQALGADRAEILMSQAHGPPAARAVREIPRDRTASRHELPGLGRYVAIAAAASFVVVLVGVSAGLMAASTSFVDSLGIGAFAAVWGGGGFGAMIGGVLYVHRFEEPAPIPSLVGSELDRSPEVLAPWPSATPVPGRTSLHRSPM